LKQKKNKRLFPQAMDKENVLGACFSLAAAYCLYRGVQHRRLAGAIESSDYVDASSYGETGDDVKVGGKVFRAQNPDQNEDENEDQDDNWVVREHREDGKRIGTLWKGERPLLTEIRSVHVDQRAWGMHLRDDESLPVRCVASLGEPEFLSVDCNESHSSMGVAGIALSALTAALGLPLHYSSVRRKSELRVGTPLFGYGRIVRTDDGELLLAPGRAGYRLSTLSEADVVDELHIASRWRFVAAAALAALSLRSFTWSRQNSTTTE
jgi:hypothetical protein